MLLYYRLAITDACYRKIFYYYSLFYWKVQWQPGKRYNLVIDRITRLRVDGLHIDIVYTYVRWSISSFAETRLAGHV